MNVISIKKSKPYAEKKIQAMLNGVVLADSITIGVKLYDENILKAIREEYSTTLGNTKILRLLNQQRDLPSDMSLSESEFTSEQNRINADIKEITDAQNTYQESFTKEHVLFIKNATLTIDDKTVIVDTRDAKTIESLGVAPEEALVVLLELYLKEPAYRDSLLKVVPKLVFNTDFEESKVKN